MYFQPVPLPSLTLLKIVARRYAMDSWSGPRCQDEGGPNWVCPIVDPRDPQKFEWVMG
jgi:hypothetical protein